MYLHVKYYLKYINNHSRFINQICIFIDNNLMRQSSNSSYIQIYKYIFNYILVPTDLPIHILILRYYFTILWFFFLL